MALQASANPESKRHLMTVDAPLDRDLLHYHQHSLTLVYDKHRYSPQKKSFVAKSVEHITLVSPIMSYQIGSSVPVPETAKQLDLLALEITNLERVVEHGEKRLRNLSSRLTETPNTTLRSNLQAGLQNEQRRLVSSILNDSYQQIANSIIRPLLVALFLDGDRLGSSVRPAFTALTLNPRQVSRAALLASHRAPASPTIMTSWATSGIWTTSGSGRIWVASSSSAPRLR